MSFPDNFTWGAAAAAYQIEGAAYEDGKGLSVWDMFCKKPGVIWGAHSGDVACDHYHRRTEDVGLMRELGLKAYRLSISWPRVIPNGTGKPNEKGLEFYDRLVDELLASNITPWVTLFHWDYPYELYKRGGWLNPESPEWFAEYTKVVAERLSDRVTHWMTQNEPLCYIVLGHYHGMHAPGLKLDVPDILQMIHNSHLSHGKSVQALRAHARKPVQAGMVSVASVQTPATESAEDIEAARKATFDVKNEADLGSYGIWTDPVYLGKYPDSAFEYFDWKMPKIGADDMKTISEPVDFIAYNIYQAPRIKAGKDGAPEQVPFAPGFPHTGNLWNVTPECIYWSNRFLSERFPGLPIYCTENGCSMKDWVALDGKCHDPQRIDMLTRYISSMERSYEEGIDVRGYFVWSIMDNFEWAEGFKERFGLIHIDYETLKRTPKDSYYWYKKLIATNGDSLHDNAAS